MSLESNVKDWDDLVREYKPRTNHLDHRASFDGCMYETFGEELNFVKKQNERNIWTILECEDKTVIASGYHLVNRLGYIVTSVPRTSNVEIEIVN